MLSPHAKLPTSIAIAAILVAAAGSASAQSGYESRTNRISQAANADLPPDARPGECYARVYVPPQSRTDTEQMLAKASSERIELVPPTFEKITEQILVKPESTRVVPIAATYEWNEETIMISPSRTEWQKGPCDPKKQLANATGECLCLVEIPARYKTMRSKVQATPPTTRTQVVPAQYSTITKTVMSDMDNDGIPGWSRSSYPGSSDSSRDGYRVRHIEIPAEYTTVTRTSMVSDAYMKWVPINCTTRAPLYDRDTTMTLQRALKAKGHDPGPIDGVFGAKTRDALRDFQRSAGLSSGRFDDATRKALGL